jgi:hypothetical protein
LVIAVLASLVVLASCDERNRIEAKIWKGADGEIVRDVKVDDEVMEEFLSTFDPKFRGFRCMTSEDLAEVVRLARRVCR